MTKVEKISFNGKEFSGPCWVQFSNQQILYPLPENFRGPLIDPGHAYLSDELHIESGKLLAQKGRWDFYLKDRHITTEGFVRGIGVICISGPITVKEFPENA